MIEEVRIENARIIFRNFAGEASRFNAAGKRNFCVILTQEQAEELEDEGWNIKWSKQRNPDDDREPYMQVTVSYENRPPRIYLITSRSKTLLKEDNIGVLDHAEIANVDLTIRPYHWEVNGSKGVKGYLNTMFVTIKEDFFASKYDDIPTMDDDDLPF